MHSGYAAAALLFDITFGTNAQGLKLGAFTTVGPDGSTRILAAVMTLREDTESFTWAFESFLEVFKKMPAVFITDGDLAIAAAARKVFSCLHQLCIYHFALTFAVNIAPALGGVHSSLFRSAQSLLWEITLNTNSYACEDWSSEWGRLEAIIGSVQVTTANEKAIATAIEWLKKADERKKRWAYRFTWASYGAGQNTTGVSRARPPPATAFQLARVLTICRPPIPAPPLHPLCIHRPQRCEALHSAIKLVINKSFKLTETLDHLSKYETIGQMRKAHKQVMLLAQQQTNAHLQLPLQTAIIKSEAVTPYAVTLVKAQATRSTTYMFYEVCSSGENREPENRLFLVCAQTGGPENADEMAAAYRSACATADGEGSHAAGVAAARAIARRPAASSAAGVRWEDSDHAEDYGLAAEVPGRWCVASVLGCSCQLYVHHG